MTRWLLRPSLWTALVAIIAYWDPVALNGGYVYDDGGSVLKNVVVTGMVPWKEAFTRDFWGTEMKLAGSHKSFRPLTTLSLKLNYDYERRNQKPQDKQPPTFSFHLVNVLLHGLVTGLVTEATAFVLGDLVSRLVVGFLFGLHPVHAEVVSNITSRGELLMSVFSLLAFLTFASAMTTHQKRANQNTTANNHQESDDTSAGVSLVGRLSNFAGIYVLPWLFMTLSIFSKEQGATTLITLVVWDFLQHHGNLVNLWKKLVNQDPSALRFLLRTLVLAIQTILVVLWRYILNGETSPDFIEAQNPAGFAKDRFTRAFSVSWVYCLYVRDALYPFYLSPDWSGISIDLVRTASDPRAIIVISLWYGAASSLWSLVVGMPRAPDSRESDRAFWKADMLLRKSNMAVWAFTFSPFLLSSNILVVVGLMKGDRVIYLPLFGFCLLEVLLLQHYFWRGKVSMPTAINTQKRLRFWAAYFFVMFQLVVFAGRTHQRNLAWSDSLRLWESAYAINPRSYHTMYNYGYELSLKQRYAEAEQVMRPIGSARVDGPSNTFVYTMVLFNLRQCDLANELLDEAFEVVAERRREGGVRNTEGNLARTESNLLVSRAHCTEDIPARARFLGHAVEVDPSNEYAVGVATQMHESIQQMEELQRRGGYQ